MGNTFELDAPVTDKDSHEFLLGAESPLRVGVSGMQGWRTSMEDSHISVDLPSIQDHTLLAVCDGHGGKETALFVKENLVRILESTEIWKSYIASGSADKTPNALGIALDETLIRLDDEMKATKDKCYVNSGGAIVVCLVTPSHIVCANSGDCRAVLGVSCSSDLSAINAIEAKSIPLSEDHKPDVASERSRIEQAGGNVSFGRVNGELALSRGVGDLRYKTKTDTPPHMQVVTCVPDITIHKRDAKTDLVLLLACDGLFDVISSDQAVQRLLEIFRLGETSTMMIAEEMIDGALFEGRSRDNISAIVCAFPAGYDVMQRASVGDNAIGVGGIRMERRLAGKNIADYDMYDNVQFMPKVEKAPGSMFYSDDY